jgi:hypothetical protein
MQIMQATQHHDYASDGERLSESEDEMEVLIV